MRLLNVEAVLRREKNIETVDPESEIEVLEEHDDESTRYAIVSHRWGKEVTYKEMTRLHAMNPQKKEDVRKRGGYQKIIMGCKRAKKDGYMWLWIDTCCIDKRSSSELSEAINSMYRWYHNSEMCYVYLHDVDEREFPIKQDFSRFGKSSGWPEWFSRGWTLQELIAPKEVEFFNKDWVSIGTKEYLTSTLEDITRIPERVLNDEEVLGGTWSPERPCIARIMSWAANRKTTRVEDRAYSLLGLFDVNMPMLYGEGRKAFQRLQLEIIRASSDHSIFAWNPRALTSSYASILAEDPGWFRGCHDIEVVNHRIFAQEIEEHIVRRGEFAVAIDEDKLSSFRNIVDFTHRLHRWDVTNFGIHLSLPVLPERDRDYLCKAILPCRHRHGELITIDLSSHDGARCHRDNSPWHKVYTCPEFRPLYLHYSGGRGRIKGLRLKDKDASSCGFTRCGAFPCDGDVVTIPSQGDSLTVSVYSNNDAGCRFAVGLGFYVNNPCVRVVWDEYSAQQEVLPSWIDFAKQAYDILWNAPVPEGFLHKENVHLPRSIFHVDIYPYERRIRIKQCPGCCGKLGEREETRVFVTNRFGGGLFKPNPSYNGEIYSPLIRGSHRLQLSGQWLVECSGQKIELGDYGSFVDGIFICRGNILKDMQRLDIVHSAYDPVSSVVSGHSHVPGQVQNQCDVVTTCCSGKEMVLHLPRDRSLPRNEDFELLLRAFSMRLAGYALVTTVIECSKFYKVADDGEWTGAEGVPEGGGQSADSGTFTPLCSVVVPRPWRQHLARRQQFERIREHFYTVADPHHIARTEPHHGSADQRITSGMVDILVMFGLDYLQKLVGKITFLERLPSIMQAWRCGEPSVVAADGNGSPTYLSSPMSVDWETWPEYVDLLWTWKGPRHETDMAYGVSWVRQDGEYSLIKKEAKQHEIGFISDSLSASLLKLIYVACDNVGKEDDEEDWEDDEEEREDDEEEWEYDEEEWEYDEEEWEANKLRYQGGHTDFDMARVRATMQNVEALQAQLSAAKDEDEQRALEEDLTGQILWFYWCGICSEVNHRLLTVVNAIRRYKRKPRMCGRRKVDSRVLHNTAEIVKGTLQVGQADDIAHLRRIMFDAGTGVSRHKLWLAARAAGRNGDVRTGSGNDATGIPGAGNNTDIISFEWYFR